MRIQPYNEFFPEAQPFILFNVPVKQFTYLNCVGYEFYCCNPNCDCQMANIMVHNATDGSLLTHLLYGWREEEFYLNEQFDPNDVKGFIKGDLNLIAPRNRLNKNILEAFRNWLAKDKKQKVQLFAGRYQKFKDVTKNIYPDKQDDEDNLAALLMGALQMISKDLKK